MLEDGGAGRAELDGKRDRQHQRRQQQQNDTRQDQVTGSLEQAVVSLERRLAHGNHGKTAHRVGAALDQIGHEHVRHKVDRSRGVLEFVKQAPDARMRRHRKRKIDQLDTVGLGERRDIGQSSQQLVPALACVARSGPVIEEPHQLDPGVVRGRQPVSERGALFVQADQHRTQRRSAHP